MAFVHYSFDTCKFMRKIFVLSLRIRTRCLILLYIVPSLSTAGRPLSVPTIVSLCQRAKIRLSPFTTDTPTHSLLQSPMTNAPCQLTITRRSPSKHQHTLRSHSPPTRYNRYLSLSTLYPPPPTAVSAPKSESHQCTMPTHKTISQQTPTHSLVERSYTGSNSTR